MCAFTDNVIDRQFMIKVSALLANHFVIRKYRSQSQGMEFTDIHVAGSYFKLLYSPGVQEKNVLP